MPRGIQRRVAQDGTIAYRVRVQRQGFPTRSATFARIADAQAWQRQQETVLLAQRHFPERTSGQYTCAVMIDRYCRDVLPHKALKTRMAQGPQLAWWRAQLGHLRLAELTPRHLTAARDALHSTHSPGTVNRYLAALSHVCTVALREWEWLDVHPFQRVRRLREPRGRVRYLDATELTALLTACQQSRNPYLYTLVILALSTGARKMELVGLRWQAVDLARGRVTFHETKNQERRSVPLVGEARRLLAQRAQEPQTSQGWVFPSPDGARPRDMREAWQVARSRAGLQDFRFHDLRHTAASYLAMAGASLADIAEILGHKTLQMARRYSHLSDAHTAGVLERMAERFLPSQE